LPTQKLALICQGVVVAVIVAVVAAVVVVAVVVAFVVVVVVLVVVVAVSVACVLVLVAVVAVRVGVPVRAKTLNRPALLSYSLERSEHATQISSSIGPCSSLVFGTRRDLVSVIDVCLYAAAANASSVVLIICYVTDFSSLV